MNRWFDNLPLIGKKIPGKIVLSFLMFVLALTLFIITPNNLKFLCLIAMTFSFIGDCILNHNKNHDNQSKTDFILGGISFIVAHIFYFFTYLKKIQINNYNFINFGFIFIMVILLIFSCVVFIKVRENKTFSKLFIFGFFYLWITGINYSAIFSYAYSSFSLESIVALGGILFLSSDMIICFEKFLGLRSKLARELVWWLYPIGQIILIIMV